MESDTVPFFLSLDNWLSDCVFDNIFWAIERDF